MKAVIVQKGGVGSGHFGHEGRPGKQGGSVPGPGDAGGSVPAKRETILESSPIHTTAAKYLNKGLDKHGASTWQDASVSVRSSVKEEIVTTLSEKSGFSEEETNNALAQWAESSNRGMYALSLQEAASEEFEVPLSTWQKGKLSAARRLSDAHIERYGNVEGETSAINNWSRDQERTFLRAMYDNTQAEFATGRAKTLTLYRGIKTDTQFQTGDLLPYDGNAIESWSVDYSQATQFGNTVIAMDIPTANILCTARTGFGCLNEGEFVVFGSVPTNQALIVTSYRRAAAATYEGDEG